MIRDNGNGITETHERGWGYYILTVVGVCIGVFLFAWAMLSVVLKSIDQAATVMIITVFAVIILVGLPGLGLFAANVIQKNTIQNVRAHDAMQQVIDAPYQVKPQAQFLTSGSTMHRAELIEAAAQKAYMVLYPDSPPTRENIAKATGSTSHEFSACVVDYRPNYPPANHRFYFASLPPRSFVKINFFGVITVACPVPSDGHIPTICRQLVERPCR